MILSLEWFRKIIYSCVLTFSIAFLFALISSCSVYKSNGRKGFEDSAPNKVDRSASLSVPEKSEPQSLCWTQNASEPLWTQDIGTPLTVHWIDSETIEVCQNSSDLNDRNQTGVTAHE